MPFPPKAKAAFDAVDESEPTEDKEGASDVDVSDSLETISSALKDLTQAFESSDAVSEKDKGRLEALKSQFSALQDSLNMSPDESDSETEPTGRLTAEAGAKDVKPVY